MSHLQLRCETGAVAAHQWDVQSHGRSGFLEAGLLLSPGQQVFLPEEPHEFISAELRPVSTLEVREL